ncbi:MAG TPA: hypothetical protein PK812_05130, partial [Beijerinckiaceae bacterium]|nr:hypothetical protein [Beijerinckiaceae bacterium]
MTALLLSLHAEAAAQDRAQNASDELFPSKPADNQRRRTAPAEAGRQPATPARSATEQGTQPGPAQPQRPATAANQPKKKVDESGLRYFASQNQPKRVEKEIQRLKALYPDWSPPDDLYLGPPGGPDEQPFWDLFGADKLEELRAKIAERMKSEPGWKPSAALMYKIERKESRNKLVAAYQAKEWQKVIEVAAADPKIMVCADIDVPWRVADAFAETGQKKQTFDVYRFILNNCRDKAFRITTLKKALGYFEPDEVDVLIAMGTRNEDGTHEFDDVRLDILRVRLGRMAEGKAEPRVQPQDIKFFEDQTKTHARSADASLLGWHRFASKDWEASIAWFKLALEWPLQLREDGSVMAEKAKMAEGHILALKGLGKFEEAEALAFQWRDKSETIRDLFVDIFGDALLRSPASTVFAPERITRYEMLVASAQSVFGTQALGWYHFSRSRWDEAVRWFQASYDWSDKEKLDTKTIEGLALALRSAARREEAEDLAFEWRDRSKLLRTIYVETFAEALVQQSPPIAFSDTRIDRYAALVMADGSAMGAQGLAWYSYDRKRWTEAARWFKASIDWSPDGANDAKLAEGLAQSLRFAGRYEEAEDVAYEWRERSPAMKVLFVEITAEHLGKIDPARPYPSARLNRFAQIVQSERSSFGAQAIAWHLYDRKTFIEAARWFRTALTFNPAETTAVKVLEGYVLSVRYQGEVREAENLAYDWRDRSESLRQIYFEIAAELISTIKPPAVYPADRMERFIELTERAKSAFGAQAIGWFHHQREDYATAAKWFNQSLQWGGDTSDPRTAQGFLLALISLGRLEEADRLAFSWHEKSEEFRTLYIDVFGGAILRATPPQAFPEGLLARFAYISGSAKSVFGSQAVAWYYYDRQNWAESARWFQASLDWAGEGKHDPKTVEGFAQSLRYLGRREEAEEILYAWRDKVPILRKLYVEIFSEALVSTSAPIFFSDERLNRYGALVLDDKDWFGAQGLAWYRHDRRQWPDAVRWFKYAREWSVDGKGDAKMAEGLAFSLRNLELYDESEFVSVEWKDKSPQMRKLYSETVGEFLVRLKNDVTYPDERMHRYLETVAADRNNIGAQSAGWYYFARDMYDPAAQWFLASLQWGPDYVRDPKTAEGYVTALRLGGRLMDAEAAAFELRDKSEQLRQLYFDIAGEAIANLKPPETYPADRLARFADLAAEARSAIGAQSIAWYFQARENWREATAWFEKALEWGIDVKDAKTAQGYLIALVGVGRYEDADRLAALWHEKSEEFRTLYIDVFGGAILRATPPQAFPEGLLARFAYISGSAKSVFGSQAVAWYYYDRQNWAESARWFQASLDWAGEGKHDPKTVEGFAQSLRYLGRREEAEEILYAWRDKVPILRKLYVEIFSEALVSTSAPIFFSDERLNRYGALVLDDKDWFGAQGLAWYRHDRRQWPDAVRWFKYAREWSVDGKGDAKMAEGLAFSLRNLELYDESEFVSVEWKDKSPQMRKLYSETVGEFLVRLKNDVTYPDERMHRYLETVAADRNNIGAQSAGWYYFARDMYDPAAQWFLASLQWGPDYVRDPKTAEGYVTALRLGGRLMDAEAAAFELRDKSEQLRQLYFDIAGEAIANLKPPETYPADRLARFADLAAEARSAIGAQSIAWYFQARENWREAAFWFEKSIQWGGEAEDPKSAEGYVVALIGLGRYEEAEALVVKWRSRSDRIAATFLEVMGSQLLRLPATATLPEERLARYGVLVGSERSLFGSQALAWYFYERKQWDDAARWFRANLDWTPQGQIDPKSIEGYAQSLRSAGRRDDAEELLFLWRDSNPTLRRLYLETFAEALVNQSAPLMFEDERIDRYADLVLNDRSSFGAQALAWYRYNRRVWHDAARWFKHARQWTQDGKGDAKMAEGLAFSLRNMDLYDESEAVSWDWRDRSPVVRKLYVETVAEYIVRLWPRETYPVDRLSRYQIVVDQDKSSIGAQAAGWYYFARDRFGEAAPWFRKALDWGPDPIRDPKTAEGLAIALRNSGQIDEAESFAFAWRDRSDRLREMYFEFSAQAMARIRPPQHYPVDRMTRFISLTNASRNAFGAQAIGWYKAERKEWADAVKWFKQALDWTGDDKDAKTIEGYAQALRNVGRIDEAETLAFMWKDRSEGMADLYLQIVTDIISKLKPTDTYPADRLDKYIQLVSDRQSVAGAQTIGWYRLQRKDFADGEKWFKLALDWLGEAKDPKVIEGYAAALRQQKKLEDAELLAWEWRDRNDGLRDLYLQVAMERLVAIKPPAVLPADRLKNLIDFTRAGKSASGALALGWYHYDRKDWASALEWFKLATEWETDPKNSKGAEGYALTLKNLGKIEEAEAYAYEWRDKSDAMRALYIDSVPEMLGKLGPTGTFPVERLKRYAALVTLAKSAYGAQALAWYWHERKDYAQAAVWFKSSLDWSGDAKDAKTAEGYVLALRSAGRLDEAELIAYEWRERADTLRTLYIESFAEALTRTNPPPPFPPDRLARYAAIVSADKSAIGAQALGWYSHNIKQFRPARAWFEKAMQWGPQEGSALGLALSARSMNDRAGYEQIVNMYRGTYPKLLELLAPQAATGTQPYATATQPATGTRVIEVIR